MLLLDFGTVADTEAAMNARVKIGSVFLIQLFSKDLDRFLQVFWLQLFYLFFLIIYTLK